MAKFKCVVREEVDVFIEVSVTAKTKEEAAQMARDAWVINGEGSKREDVNGRWVEIDGDLVDTKDG